MSRAASPFSSRTVVAVVAVGAAAFLLLLYAIGAGWDGSRDRNGGAHAAANGLNGFAGLVRLLESRGHEVALSRSEGRLEDEGLLVLTPQHAADGEALSRIIAARRYSGPTLLILPKWVAVPADRVPELEAPTGWVMLGGAVPPGWLAEIDTFDDAELAVGTRRGWSGLGLRGSFPDAGEVLSLDATRVLPLVTDEQGDVLAGYLADAGTYPTLAEAAQMPDRDPEELDTDPDLWPVVVIVEPDLANNYGLADARRARAAVELVEAALQGQDLPIIFDLSVAGLGRGQNLLTLAFEPPFLAATLCLILAAMLVAWRSFRRFGPPVAEVPELAMGKLQLASNSAALIERSKRLHLLGPPYAALLAARMARALGIRETEPRARAAAIAAALSSRGVASDYLASVDALRHARRPAELLRAAAALKTIERTLAA